MLRTEQTLSDQAYERLKKDFEERHTGLGNAHRPMILEMGLDWKSMALNAEDSQFLETRKFQLEEICRLFRVPLHMVQNTDRATFNNIEELGLGFINYSLVPYLTRIEQRINTGLVRKSKQGVYYAKFNAGALLRGDMKSRFEAYATGINWGIYSPNDCRDLEDMNPRPGGDVYLTPMNMTTKPSDGSKAGINTRLEQSARIIQRTPDEVLPALVLAATWFDNAARDADIIRRNAITHPGFVPVIPLKVPVQ